MHPSSYRQQAILVLPYSGYPYWAPPSSIVLARRAVTLRGSWNADRRTEIGSNHESA